MVADFVLKKDRALQKENYKYELYSLKLYLLTFL